MGHPPPPITTSRRRQGLQPSGWGGGESTLRRLPPAWAPAWPLVPALHARGGGLRAAPGDDGAWGAALRLQRGGDARAPGPCSPGALPFLPGPSQISAAGSSFLHPSPLISLCSHSILTLFLSSSSPTASPSPPSSWLLQCGGCGWREAGVTVALCRGKEAIRFGFFFSILGESKVF